MPVYLCHGFRWHRDAIRVFVIFNDLDDAAPDWIIGPATSRAILEHFTHIFPFIPDPSERDPEPVPRAAETSVGTPHPRPAPPSDAAAAAAAAAAANLPRSDSSLSEPTSSHGQDAVLAHSWSAVHLLEEHDPQDLSEHTRPYAYVADRVVRVDRGAGVQACMDDYDRACRARDASWFAMLRDKLAPGETMQWYVVVCGDEDRQVAPEDAFSLETGHVAMPNHTAAPRLETIAEIPAWSQSSSLPAQAQQPPPPDDAPKTQPQKQEPLPTRQGNPQSGPSESSTDSGRARKRAPQSLSARLKDSATIRRLLGKKDR
ncbi:hypothetical protein S7711_00800 [Stachybotrys chartarum IBT 7711]|uniref:Developmental regulator n=1 Tax=Stachybotrys chartarum (strain CBS 109288 / IBT 7711) TaxID=1280523 RepID=A0A084B084_STACB|nr:hypothetical protein S7711_00800 [Stachybotrys chartarum IBT 7711]